MIKLTQLTILLILATSFSKLNAQSAPVFGLGLTAGQGMGRADGLAIGFDLRFQIAAEENLYIPITIGYTSIMAKDQISVVSGKTYKVDSEKYFAIKSGFKYFFTASNAGFYGLAEAGLVLGTEVPKGGGVHLPFVFSPALGYAWSKRLDVAVKYETFTKQSYAGIRLGYGF